MSMSSRVRASGDQGSALAIALTFLMVFGLLIGVVLQFATTGQRTTLTVRDEATSTYAGGGAINGAINAIRANLTQGTQSTGSSTCFTVPADQLGNPTPVAVTCAPRSGSGASIGGGTTSQPAQAVLTRSANPAEGVVLGAGARVPFQGDVAARALVSVPAGASLSSTDSVTAGGACVGTTSPACAVAAAPADPGWAGPSTASTPLMGALPACATLTSLSPGIYRSAAALQTVLNCAGAVVWFQPGTYFFDFTDAVTHELVIGPGDVVVGGTASGWTPGAAGAAGIPPYPTSGSPGASGCDTGQPGVDLVFGGDSRLTVQGGGNAQFCALVTGTSAQHIVLRSSAGSSVASTGASGTTASSEIVVPGARLWANAAGGAAAGGTSANVKLPNANDPPSKLLVGPVSATLVPADATGITVTTTVRESLNGTGNSRLAVRPGNGGATLASVLLRDCLPVSPCGGSVTGPWSLDTATATGLTPAQVNGMSFEVIITNPNHAPIEAWIDGVTVTVTFSVPIQAAGGTVTGAPAYTPGSATTTPLLLASGATTVLALHGTVYAPAAVVDIGLTGVPYTVVDRGLVVRHLQLSMTPAAAGGPALISIPSLGQQPRRVLLTTSTGARADVTFANAAGTRNGSIPTVLEWSVG